MIVLIMLAFGLMSAINIDVRRFAQGCYRSESAWISERKTGRSRCHNLLAGFRKSRR